MKVLMISTDRSILTEGSAARARMAEYGNLVNELHVLVFSKRKNFQFSTNFQSIFNDSISKNVFVHPTNSWSRWFYVFDAYRIAKRRIGNWKLEIGNSRDQQLLITSQDPFETGLVGVFLKWRFGVPLQVQIHTDFLNPYFARQSFLNRARVLLARFILPRADCIRVVSERVCQNLLQATGYMLQAQPVVLPIFVDVARFSARPDEGAVRAIRARYPQFDRIILMVGRLAPEKNIALAIEAMREVAKVHPHAGLMIVGSGDVEKNPPEAVFARSPALCGKGQGDEAIQRDPRLLRSLRGARKDACEEPQIVFETTTRDIAPYYHAADIFLHTSNYEGYGMVLVEAAAAGLPIVTTDVGVVGDVLKDGKSALVCPVGDRACIAKRLLRLLGDNALRARIGGAAQEAAKQQMVSKEESLKQYRASWEACTYG